MKKIKALILEHRIWKSVFRHDFSDTERNRSIRTFGNFFLHLHPVKVKKHAVRFKYTFCMGGLSLLLFLILTWSGIMLMFYYHPSVPTGYNDMKDLGFVVSSGVFLRNVHRWSAHLMVAFVFFHMCRVFFTGAYKPPREFNWVIGVTLLVLTLLLSFTGYLLPWDQLAFWAITVGTNMSSYAPVVGEKIRFVLLGGNIVSENALLRFYVLHCVVLPLVITIFLALHFWRIRKDGGISGPL
ncbi:MAG: cytochrome B6 [Gammaproteobacteria bacterium]|nr:cytochrome B6 [Gammaproteobacteria bacterium]HJP17275.1 cytochrome b N-terminal domain-containing protein [Nitrospinota bacterium]|tara:strand:- start:14657 stop:15376 length:720 start_codon:yes stop_codon:yes gene_type:complete